MNHNFVISIYQYWESQFEIARLCINLTLIYFNLYNLIVANRSAGHHQVTLFAEAREVFANLINEEVSPGNDGLCILLMNTCKYHSMAT